MSKKHRNSLDNDEPHHLYVINDKKTKDVFKYGISCDPIDEDGLSDRIRSQSTCTISLQDGPGFSPKYFLEILPEEEK